MIYYDSHFDIFYAFIQEPGCMVYDFIDEATNNFLYFNFPQQDKSDNCGPPCDSDWSMRKNNFSVPCSFVSKIEVGNPIRPI